MSRGRLKVLCNTTYYCEIGNNGGQLALWFFCNTSNVLDISGTFQRQCMPGHLLHMKFAFAFKMMIKHSEGFVQERQI